MARLGEDIPILNYMAGLRPRPARGSYFKTPGARSRIRCKAYTEPPLEGCAGSLITTMAPGTYFGPVESVVQTEMFASVLVRGYWINIWRRGAPPREPWGWGFEDEGVCFALEIPSETIASWRNRGWRDRAASVNETQASWPRPWLVRGLSQIVGEAVEDARERLHPTSFFFETQEGRHYFQKMKHQLKHLFDHPEEIRGPYRGDPNAFCLQMCRLLYPEED